MASFVIGGSTVAEPSPETPTNVGTDVVIGDYAGLSDLRTYLSLASAETGDDAELRKMLTRSSRAIDKYTRRHFYPLRRGGNEALKFDLPDNSTELRFDIEDVLEVHGLSDVNGSSEIDSSVYWLRSGDQWNISPYDRIKIDDSSGSIFKYSGTTQKAVHVDAVIGYRENYSQAWIDSGATLTSALGATTTLASVSGSAGENSLGLAPRLSAGQIWRLGSGSSEEYVYAKDTLGASSIRLIRAINGTSATTHGSTTKIFTWQPEPEIEESVLELVAFAYHKARSPFTNRLSNFATGVIEMPDAWPDRTIEKLQRYKNRGVYSL